MLWKYLFADAFYAAGIDFFNGNKSYTVLEGQSKELS